MRISDLLAISVVACAAVMTAMGVASAQERRWAALLPNNEVSSSVVWGATEAQARERAATACRNVSRSCSSKASATADLGDVFALMCCTNPRLGCAAAVEASRSKAVASVQEIFGDAGFSGCTLRAVYSARTGAKQ